MNTAPIKSLDIIDAHQKIWARINALLVQNRLPQAFLFSGPRHINMMLFVDRLMARILCEQQPKSPCGTCQSCHLLIHGIHPDIQYLGLSGESLKIDEIRELQRDVYQTPQRGQMRFIVILAQGLNASVANSLLKILEEPPVHTHFILLSESPNLLPPTILSRCQHYLFSESTNDSYHYSMIEQAYPQGSIRRELFKQRDAWVDMLCDMIHMKTSPCTVAQKWSQYELEDVLWFLYLITAETIQVSLMPKPNHPLVSFASQVSPIQLFNQLRTLSQLIKKNHQKIAINATLALEALLFGYIKEDSNI